MSLPSAPPAILSSRNRGRYENRALMKIYHVWCFIHGQVDVPYHWHRELELLLVLRGRFRLVVDGEVHDLRQDDLMIVNAGTPHNSVSISEDALICGLHLDTGHFERLGLPGFAARFCLARPGPDLVAVRDVKALMAQLSQIDESDPQMIVKQAVVAMMLATTIYRDLSEPEEDTVPAQQRGGNHARIAGIMARLDGGRREITLDEIAAEERVTASHLSRMFKQHLGMGFRDYRISLRLDAAAEDLRASTDTIAQIMEQNGFGNPAVFYRKFRQRFGSTPANYRRERSAIEFSGKLSEQEREAAMTILRARTGQVGEACQMFFRPCGTEGR